MHADTKTEAMNWLWRRSFGAIIIDGSVPEAEELQAHADAIGVPVITITTERSIYTAGVTAATVKEVLTTVFKLAPLDWFRGSQRIAA